MPDTTCSTEQSRPRNRRVCVCGKKIACAGRCRRQHPRPTDTHRRSFSSLPMVVSRKATTAFVDSRLGSSSGTAGGKSCTEQGKGQSTSQLHLCSSANCCRGLRWFRGAKAWGPCGHTLSSLQLQLAHIRFTRAAAQRATMRQVWGIPCPCSSHCMLLTRHERGHEHVGERSQARCVAAEH